MLFVLSLNQLGLSFTLERINSVLNPQKMQHPRYFENHLSDKEEGEEVSAAQKDYVPELLQIIHKNCPPIPDNCEGAMYVGAAGIGYAFYHVAECPTFADRRDSFLNTAEQYIKVSLDHCSYAIGVIREDSQIDFSTHNIKWTLSPDPHPPPLA